MIEKRQPVCWIVAGPNGAGKTTFALKYLPEVAGCDNFVNADLIAAGLSPLAPEKELLAASRIYLAEIERCEGSSGFCHGDNAFGSRLRALDQSLQTGRLAC
jgi:predicted ABC-type ATPase